MVKQRSESISEFNCRRICGDREANSGKRKKAKLDNKPDTLLIVPALWDMAGFNEFVNQREKLSSSIDARQRSSLESCNIDPENTAPILCGRFPPSCIHCDFALQYLS